MTMNMPPEHDDVDRGPIRIPRTYRAAASHSVFVGPEGERLAEPIVFGTVEREGGE